MKKIILAIIVVVLVLIAFGLSRNKNTTQTKPVKIGGMFSLSGYAAFAGEASRDGFLLAIEDSGMDIPYVVEDFKSDPKTAVIAAQKLINVDGVNVVIGPEWAQFGEPIVPIADEKKVVFISPWMTSETEWLKSPYYFSGTPSDRLEQKGLINYLYSHNVKGLVLIYTNDEWANTNIRMFKEELKKKGSFNILGEFKFNEDATDYRTELVKIKKLNPDGIYSLIANQDKHGVFSKQMNDLGINIPIYVDSGKADSPTLRKNFLSFIVGQTYAAPVEYKNKSKFNAKFEKRYGHKPGAISAAVAYDMTTLMLNAVKAGAKNSEDIKMYLENTKNYDGYSNLITFDELGQVENEEIVIKRITKEGSEVLR